MSSEYDAPNKFDVYLNDKIVEAGLIHTLLYAFSFSIPLACGFGLAYSGLWSYAAIILSFVIMPILDQLLPKLSLRSIKPARYFFNIDTHTWLLLLNVPVIYGLICFAALQWSQHPQLSIELIGQIISLGLVLGSNGINVAHELGHRTHRWAHFSAWSLLLPNGYLHFFVEHNYGHHRWVATKHDPATARLNENVYAFWWRSIRDSYLSAWRIQHQQLQKKQQLFWSRKNLMLWFTISQLIYLFSLWTLLPGLAALGITLAGLVGLSLLEVINYIEHYGLLRQPITPGRFERMRACHSWNADYLAGRIMLYELTLHSDHHYLARKPYQTLESHEDAPILPFGYPAAMLCSLIPPLWFQTINPRVPRQIHPSSST